MTPEQIWGKAKRGILAGELQRVYDVTRDCWIKPEGEDIARWAVYLVFARHTPSETFDVREAWRREHRDAYLQAVEIGKRELTAQPIEFDSQRRAA